MQKDKSIKLYTMDPLWVLFLYPSFVCVLLSGSFIVNSVVLLAGFALLKIPNKLKIYKKMIWKVWLFGLASIALCALLLWVWTERMWTKAQFPPAWFEYIVILLPGAATYFLNYHFALKRLEITKPKRILFSLALAVLTSPYLLLRPYYHFVYDLFTRS